MRAAEGSNDVVVSVLREDGFEAQLRHTLLAPALADRRVGALAGEEGPRSFRVPRAALVGSDPPGADCEERVTDRIERLGRDEDDELSVHDAQNSDVERVIGIGGVFFRARDPDALRHWYADHLGIELEDYGGAIFPADGETVWSIFPAETDYFGPSGQLSMLNYRVRDLNAVLAQLREAGAPVDEEIEEDENGRFGWATDPEGNRFELWQPPTR